MQQELGDQAALLGVNAVDYESSNDTYTADADLPLLQDTTSSEVWESWDVEWRDVWVLDPENRPHTLISLNDYDLSRSEDYDMLEGLILEAGGLTRR